MQFRFVNPSDVLGENRAMAPKSFPGLRNSWGNVGGDQELAFSTE